LAAWQRWKNDNWQTGAAGADSTFESVTEAHLRGAATKVATLLDQGSRSARESEQTDIDQELGKTVKRALEETGGARATSGAGADAKGLESEVRERHRQGVGVWIGDRPVDDMEWRNLDESQFIFPDGLVSAISDNTVDFLIGKHRALLAAWGLPPKRGVVLYGRPGNGKTVLCRVVTKKALAAGLNVVLLDWTNLQVGVGTQLALAASQGPVLIIIDDLEIYAAQRARADEAQSISLQRQLFVAELLAFLDGVTESQGYTVLATTKSLEELDPALLRSGRLDVHIHVNDPPEEHRRRILEQLLTESATVGMPDLSRAVTLLKGGTYADVSELAKRYKIAVVEKYGRIDCDQELLDSVASQYAHEIGLLETAEEDTRSSAN